MCPLKNWLKISLLSLLLWGCAPSSIEDLRWEAEAETRRLAKELKEIDTKEDLNRALPKLKRRYNRLAELLLETRNFPEKGSGEPSLASEELFVELARLYEMPGGRESIEMAQNEAVRKLDRSKIR